MSDTHWTDKIAAGFEPEINGDRFETFSEAALCSLAISMKRIADALTTVPCNEYGETLIQAIPASIARGLR